jgi:hypothetical protein
MHSSEGVAPRSIDAASSPPCRLNNMYVRSEALTGGGVAGADVGEEDAAGRGHRHHDDDKQQREQAGEQQEEEGGRQGGCSCSCCWRRRGRRSPSSAIDAGRRHLRLSGCVYVCIEIGGCQSPTVE